jgi:hypothetical protein
MSYQQRNSCHERQINGHKPQIDHRSPYQEFSSSTILKDMFGVSNIKDADEKEQETP